MAAVREGAGEQELGHPDARDDQRGREHSPATVLHAERDACEEDREQKERQRARGGRQDGEDAEAPALARLERPDREQAERDAEGERERRRDDEAGPDDCERPARPARERPPLPADDDGERERRSGDRRDRERLDPEDAGERVVENAVRDEAVAASVPEVVPELEAVVEENSPLVDVGSQIVARRPEPDQECCKRGGGAGGEHRLAQEKVHAAQVLRSL